MKGEIVMGVELIVGMMASRLVLTILHGVPWFYSHFSFCDFSANKIFFNSLFTLAVLKFERLINMLGIYRNKNKTH